MNEKASNKVWQAEAGTEETKQFIKDVRRVTRRKFTPEEKIRIVMEGFRRETPIRDCESSAKMRHLQDII